MMTEHTMRERLPNDRKAITAKVKIGGHKLYITVGLFPDGRPGELFCHCDKGGSTMNGLLSTISILTSIALQHGITVEYLRNKFDDMRFEPNGTTTHPAIPVANSIPDFIFKWIDGELKRGTTLAKAKVIQEYEREMDSRNRQAAQ